MENTIFPTKSLHQAKNAFPADFAKRFALLEILKWQRESRSGRAIAPTAWRVFLPVLRRLLNTEREAAESGDTFAQNTKRNKTEVNMKNKKFKFTNQTRYKWH